jgi:hypothetical protein
MSSELDRPEEKDGSAKEQDANQNWTRRRSGARRRYKSEACLEP